MTNEASPSGEVSQTVERLFRHESGKMVATLTRIFGVEHLTLAEDVGLLPAIAPLGIVPRLTGGRLLSTMTGWWNSTIRRWSR
jgi:hypothetical protein